MKRSKALLRFSAFLFLSGFSILSLQGQTVLNVKTDQPLSKIEPTMWGIFFEDINFAADGGLYAELVKNRSFEFAQPLMGWKEQESNKYAIATNAGSVLILHEGGDARGGCRGALLDQELGHRKKMHQLAVAQPLGFLDQVAHTVPDAEQGRRLLLAGERPARAAAAYVRLDDDLDQFGHPPFYAVASARRAGAARMGA